MILNEQQDPFNLAVKLTNEGKDYTIFISSDHMRCFSRGEHGHVRQTCPNKQKDKLSNSQTIEQHAGQNNTLVPVVETVPKENTDVRDVENHDTGEETVNLANKQL